MGKKDWKKLWDEEITDDQLMKYEGAGIRKTFFSTGANYHVDNEGKTTPTPDGKVYYNLQVQAVAHPKATSLAEEVQKAGNKGLTYAHVMVDVEASPTAEELRNAFKESYNGTPAPKKVYIHAKK